MLDVTERYSQAHYFKGYCENLKGNPRGAINEIEKAIQLDPFNPDYMVALTRLYLFIGDVKNSQKWFSELELTYPQNSEIEGLTSELMKLTQNFN